jgi:hypothetical protein
MATKRKTGKDYKAELQDLEAKKRSLETKVNERLHVLATEYPTVDLPTSRAGGLKCANISHPWIILEINMVTKIQYIETIEKYIADQHPHKQTKFQF